MTNKSDHDDETNPRPEFDRKMGRIHGLPDVLHTGPANCQIHPNIAGGDGEHWIVQTYRTPDIVDGKAGPFHGDTIFLTRICAEGTTRLALPPKVAVAIARQRDQLNTKSRSKSSKRTAQERKDRGEQPAFMKAKKAKWIE